MGRVGRACLKFFVPTAELGHLGQISLAKCP